ncbi:MAG TPA: hypothetical protein VFB99_04075 [Vicinamibacterales bacterium]|nr:hypothetical protein [Vicinamibacterales bacterium]
MTDLAPGQYRVEAATTSSRQKASLSGPLTDKVAGRISFSGSGRDGFIYNTKTQAETNTLNNVGSEASCS